MARAALRHTDALVSGLKAATRATSDEMDLTEDALSAPAAISLFFSKLPRELRDECYRHAYKSDDDHVFKMTSLSEYMRKERDRRKYGSLRSGPVLPRETPTCPVLNMRVSKRFYVEAVQQWFRQREIICSERYVFNSICDASSTLRRCLTNFSCVWDSCYFLSDGIAEACSSFVQLKRCKGIRKLTVEVRERTFEEFNRLACVDTFTADDFKLMQEARDLLTLPLLSIIEMKPSKCSLAVTEGEKAKWIENVAALDAYMKSQLKQQNLIREQQKANGEATEQDRKVELARRLAQKQKILQSRAGGKGRPTETTKPAGLLARARSLLGLRNEAPKDSKQLRALRPVLLNRKHPALRPTPTGSTVRSADWKVSQDKIRKRALVRRDAKEHFPFMDRTNDLEDAYAGIQELFEGRATPPQQPERGGLAAFYKRYPVVVVSLATTTTLSIVNSIALCKVLLQK